MKLIKTKSKKPINLKKLTKTKSSFGARHRGVDLSLVSRFFLTVIVASFFTTALGFYDRIAPARPRTLFA